MRAVRAGWWAFAAALAAAGARVGVARGDDGPSSRAPGANSAAKVRAGLLAADPAERAKALSGLEALLAHDPAALADMLSPMKEILRLRPGAERARVARLLLRLPGEEAAGVWWNVMDPAKEDDDRVLAAAVEAVSDRASEPALARRLLDAARDPRIDPWRRALAIEALGGIDSPAAPLVLHAARAGADWVEESCRALGLGRRGGADSVRPLLDLLTSAHASPRVHAWESLVRITHRDFPAKPEPWEAWWKEQRGKLPATPAAEPAAAAGDAYREPEPSHLPRYYGVALRGRGSSCHAVFCLDVSASMSEHGMEPARKHLTETLRECSTHTAFDVVAFNENVMPWAGRLVRAHPVAKARAIAWLDAIVPKSYTNIYDAVETAFQYMGLGRSPAVDPQRLDVVFLLSDGAPNRGRYHVADQVLRAISALSQRRVPIHTIGAGETVLPLLRDIAFATGGTFQEAFD